MKLVLMQGVVMAKCYFETVDDLYMVTQKKIKVGFFKWEKKKVIVKLSMFSQREIEIESFNEKNRYYDKIREKVIYQPHCDLHLSDGSKKSKFFETKKELSDFMNFIIANNITIEIHE